VIVSSRMIERMDAVAGFCCSLGVPYPRNACKCTPALLGLKPRSVQGV